MQRQALQHGFRPAHLAVAVRGAGSPFTAYERYGLEVEIGDAGEPPNAEVIQNLLQIWQRAQASR